MTITPEKGFARRTRFDIALQEWSSDYYPLSVTLIGIVKTRRAVVGKISLNQYTSPRNIYSTTLPPVNFIEAKIVDTHGQMTIIKSAVKILLPNIRPNGGEASVSPN